MLPWSTRSLLLRMPRMLLTVTDLPLPLSPTMASVSPRWSVRSTPRMAFTRPANVLKEMDRSEIRRMVSRSWVVIRVASCHMLRIWGSMASRRPSPSRLNESISTESTAAGSSTW